MRRFLTRIKILWYLLRGGELGEIRSRLRFRFSSHTVSIGLLRNLELEFPAPSARIPIRVRKLKASEHDWLSNVTCRGASREDEYELLLIRKLINSRMPGCHVAETEAGEIVFIQWLIPSTENDRIQSYFNGSLPVLWPNEAIIEVAFTFPEYRGNGIMPAAMARIAYEAGMEGILRVVAFPEIHNLRTLKACKRAGFVPYILKDERWLFFVRRLTYHPLSEHLPPPFDGDREASTHGPSRPDPEFAL